MEKACEIRPIGAAIGLYPNGLTALEYIHAPLKELVLQKAIPQRYFERRNLQNEIIQVTDVQNKPNVTSPVYYPWYTLQQDLLEVLPAHILRLGCELVDFCQQEDRVHVYIRNSGEHCQYTCRILIGADGIRSTTREKLFGPVQPRYYDRITRRAIINATYLPLDLIPPVGTQVTFQGQIPGQSFAYRMTLLPDVLTVTAASPVSSFQQFLSQKNETSKLARFHSAFEDYPSPVQSLMAAMDEDGVHEDVLSDIPIPSTWFLGRTVLLGDAAHAMTPHMGQGANMGLEDVCDLVQRLVPVLQK